MAGNFVLYSLLSGVLSLVGATPTQEEELCLTPSCSQAAANVLNNLHPDYESIDPCEDFDQCKQIDCLYLSEADGF
jgi:endothelin-converting enzyme